MNVELINRHLQVVCIQFISYRGQLPALAAFVRHSIGDQAPTIEEITHYLQKAETHAELMNWEIGLWKNTVGDWSLVSLATPPTIAQMRYRLDNFPISNTQCRFCLQDSRRLAHIDLIVERDIHGEPVHRSLLHRQCAKPWSAMRTQVARAGVTT